MPRKWRIELLASIYLGNELIHIDTREYPFCEVRLVLPSGTASAGTFTAEVYDVATCHLSHRCHRRLGQKTELVLLRLTV